MSLLNEKRSKSRKCGFNVLENTLNLEQDLCCFKKRSGVKIEKFQALFIEITQDNI